MIPKILDQEALLFEVGHNSFFENNVYTHTHTHTHTLIQVPIQTLGIRT